MFLVQALLHTHGVKSDGARKGETRSRERERDRDGQMDRSMSATSAVRIIQGLCAHSEGRRNTSGKKARDHLCDLHLVLFGTFDFGPSHYSAVVMLSQESQMWRKQHRSETESAPERKCAEMFFLTRTSRRTRKTRVAPRLSAGKGKFDLANHDHLLSNFHVHLPSMKSMERHLEKIKLQQEGRRSCDFYSSPFPPSLASLPTGVLAGNYSPQI